MEGNKFWKELTTHLEFPFDIEDVEVIDSQLGIVWFGLKNGDVYFIKVQITDES